MMNYYSGMMGGGAGFGFLITLLLIWTLLALAIAALWKYITKK